MDKTDKELIDEHLRKQHEKFIKELRKNETPEEKKAREKEYLKIQRENAVLSLHVGAMAGHLTQVKRSIESEKVDVDTLDKDGRTALFYAAQRNHQDVMKYLIMKGANDKFVIKACEDILNSAGRVTHQKKH